METHSDKVHACRQCDMKSKSRDALRKHEQTAHAEGEPFECDECGKLRPHKRTLYEHKRSVHADRKVECPVCGKQVHQTNLSRHMDTHTRQPCKCDACGTIHRNASALAEHKRRNSAHSEPAHRCEQCGKMFGTTQALRRHVATLHNDKREEYRCTRCARTFKTRRGQEDHMRTAHSETRFTCNSECGIHSATRAEYIAHLKRRHSKQHPATCKCAWVDSIRALKVATNLGNTVFVVADGTMKCTDDSCDFATTCARQMESHKEQRHDDNYRPVLRCSICQKWLSSPKNLKRHNALKHQGERRFKRDKCGRMTYPPGADDRSSHGGDDKLRRYKCGDCGYISNDKANFIGHLTSCEQGTGVVNRMLKLAEPKTENLDVKRESPHAPDDHSHLQPSTSSGSSSLFFAAPPSVRYGQPAANTSIVGLFSASDDRRPQAATSGGMMSLFSTARFRL